MVFNMLTSSSSGYSWPTRVVIDTVAIGTAAMGVGRIMQYMGSSLFFDNCEAITNCARNVFGQGIDTCGGYVFQGGKFTFTIIPNGIFHIADWFASGRISAADESLKIREFFALFVNAFDSVVNVTAKESWRIFKDYGVPAMGTAAKAGFDFLWWTGSSRPGLALIASASIIYTVISVRKFLSEIVPVPKDIKISF